MVLAVLDVCWHAEEAVSIQTGDVVGKVVNVFFTQGAGDTGHIACVIISVLGFEVFEGFHHVIQNTG
jgi:hypothetical protein